MLPLASAPLNVPLRVTALSVPDGVTQQLGHRGLAVGVEMVLLQRFPTYQVRVGSVQMQLHPLQGQAIWVEPMAAL